MLNVLSPLDWLCVAVLLVSLLVGVWRGLVVEVLSLLSWLAAFVLAQWLAPDVAGKLPMAGAGEAVRYAAGFLLVFVATLIAAALIGWALSRFLSAVGLGIINRLLGALFGALRGVVLILAATVVVNLTPWKAAPLWQSSVAMHWANGVLASLTPMLPQAFAKYLLSS
ncbi:MAG: CvpA family protein [Rhodoferax sp.]|nr:CvpA family protein [Rhodoferax sp.]